MDSMFVLVFSDGAISSKTSTCNHLAHLIKITDAGTRAMGYNEYGEQKTDCLVAGGKTHLAIQKTVHGIPMALIGPGISGKSSTPAV